MAVLGLAVMPVALLPAGRTAISLGNGSHLSHKTGVTSLWGVRCSSLQGHGCRDHLRSTPRRSMEESRRAVTAAAGEGGGEGYLSDGPPQGCNRVKVTLGRPLGMVLEEDKVGNIYVAEINPSGNAKRSGVIDVGDQLIATSAVVYNDSDDYLGVTVMKGMQEIRLNVRGERFETIMAAIRTHPAHMKVTLELQKCKLTSD